MRKTGVIVSNQEKVQRSTVFYCDVTMNINLIFTYIKKNNDR